MKLRATICCFTFLFSIITDTQAKPVSKVTLLKHDENFDSFVHEYNRYYLLTNEKNISINSILKQLNKLLKLSKDEFWDDGDFGLKALTAKDAVKVGDSPSFVRSSLLDTIMDLANKKKELRDEINLQQMGKIKKILDRDVDACSPFLSLKLADLFLHKKEYKLAVELYEKALEYKGSYVLMFLCYESLKKIPKQEEFKLKYLDLNGMILEQPFKKRRDEKFLLKTFLLYKELDGSKVSKDVTINLSKVESHLP